MFKEVIKKHKSSKHHGGGLKPHLRKCLILLVQSLGQGSSCLLGIFNGSAHVNSHANWKVSFSIIGFLVSRENFSWPWTWHVASCCTKILNVCQSVKVCQRQTKGSVTDSGTFSQNSVTILNQKSLLENPNRVHFAKK